MKLFAVTAATLLAVAPVAPVSAAVIDPITFGETFCALRRAGVNHATAVEDAVEASFDGSRTARVLADGQDLDVRLGTRAIELICPEMVN